LDKEQLDACVGRSLQGLLQPGVARPFLASRLAHRSSSADSRLRHHSFQNRLRRLEQLLRVRVRLARRPPARQSVTSFVSSTSNSRADLFGADEHDGLRGQLPDAQVGAVSATSRKCCPTMCSMCRFVPGLRPAALIVPAGHLARFVGNLDELGAAQAKDLPRSRPTAATAPVPTDERSPRSPDRLARDRHVVDAPAWIRERDPKCRASAGKTTTPRAPVRSKPSSNHCRIRPRSASSASRWWCDSEAFRSSGETLRLRKLRLTPSSRPPPGSGVSSARG